MAGPLTGSPGSGAGGSVLANGSDHALAPPPALGILLPMRRTLGLIGLLLVVALPFRGALDVGFLQDDFNVAQVLGPELSFRAETVFHLVHPPADEQDTRLRPLAYLSLLADIAAYGLDPFGIHLTGLLLHLIATALIFALAATLWPVAPRFPWLAALFFGLLPAHADSVGWLAARADPMVGVFSLATLLAYARYRLHGRNAAAIACLLLYAAALLSKEAAVITPGLAALMEPALRRRARPGGLLPAMLGLGLLTTAYLLYRRHLFGVFLGTYGAREATAWNVDGADLAHAVSVLFADTPVEALRPLLWIVPLAALAILLIARRPGRAPIRGALIAAITLLAAVALAALPVGPFLAQANGRHFYLAAAPLAALPAAALAHPGLRRGVWLAPVALIALVYAGTEAVALRAKLGAYLEAGRITAAARRDLASLRAEHPDLRLIIVDGLRRSWRTAPLFHSGFEGMARPPFQTEPIPVTTHFRHQSRDSRWEAFAAAKPAVLVRLRTPPEAPGLEPLSPILRTLPPRRPTADWVCLAPTGDVEVTPSTETLFRFRVPHCGPHQEPLRLVLAFPGERIVPLLLAPRNLVAESGGPPGTRTFAWRPSQGVAGSHDAVPVAAGMSDPIPVVWWVEQADLDHRGVRPVAGSRKARFRFVP